MNHDILTTQEVANDLRVDPATVRRWIISGALPAMQFGRDYRVERHELDAFKSRHRLSRAVTA